MEIDNKVTTYENLFNHACLNGNIESAQSIYQNHPFINISNTNEYPFRSACTNGHLDIAKWLFHTKQNINISIDDDCIFRLVCLHGHLHIAKWLYEICPTINLSAQNEYAFCGACKNDHSEVVTWLLSVHLKINLSIENDYIFREVCEYGNLKMAKWLLTINPAIDITAANNDAFYAACHKNHLHITQWLYPFNTINHSNPIDYSKAFQLACCSGSFAVAEWLYSIQTYPDHLIIHSLELACYYNHFSIVTWLTSLSSNYLSQFIHCIQVINKLFIHLCSNGYIDIVEWLYNNIERNPDNPKIPQSVINSSYYAASKNGQIVIIQWLHHHQQQYPILPELIQIGWNSACNNEKLLLMKWLYGEEYISLKNVVFDDNQLNWSCQNQYLELLKWRNQVNPFSERKFDELFHHSIGRGYDNVMEWIIQVNPTFNYIQYFKVVANRLQLSDSRKHIKIFLWYLSKCDANDIIDAILVTLDKIKRLRHRKKIRFYLPNYQIDQVYPIVTLYGILSTLSQQLQYESFHLVLQSKLETSTIRIDYHVKLCKKYGFIHLYRWFKYIYQYNQKKYLLYCLQKNTLSLNPNIMKHIIELV
jgi:hypothetical protein